ncbi:MAG: portal protein [Candidatus Thorarchaeota archaeon]
MNDKELKLHTAAMDRFQNAEEYEREDRIRMEEDFSFAAGEQWPLTIKNERELQDRPCLTFNRLPAFIEQVVGDARQNKPAIKVHPVDDGADVELATVYEGLIRNIEAQSRATSAYITALNHAVTGSRGAWRIVTEYAADDSFEQDIRIKRILNPFAASFDPGAKEYDKSDANWCFVSEWMTKESFELKYPDKMPADWLGEYRRLGTNTLWMNDERVRIAEYWVKEPVTKEIHQLSSGEVVEGELPETIIRNGDVVTIVKTRKVKSHKVVRYVLSGHEVLEGPQEFPSKYIPIVPCFGPEEYLGDQTRYRSLIRYAKDPQNMYNYWQTAIAEKISNAPKSPWLVTANMVKGLETFWANANKENRAYLPYNIDKEAPGTVPRRQEPAYVNQAEIQQSQQAIADLKATMGMYDASLGAQSNETSGRAIIARQREGDTATFAWIDNLSRSIEQTGRILIDMIPRVYDTQRIVRVLGEDDSIDMVPINFVDNGQKLNDITVGKYDVIITVGPSYQTKRLEAAESLMQFVQALPMAGQVAGDLIAKNMDWPGADAIADRLKKLLPPGMAEEEDLSPEEMQQRQMEAQQAEEEENIAKEMQMKEILGNLEEQQTKISELQAKIDKMDEETQGIELDNARKAVELGLPVESQGEQSVETRNG